MSPTFNGYHQSAIVLGACAFNLRSLCVSQEAYAFRKKPLHFCSPNWFSVPFPVTDKRVVTEVFVDFVTSAMTFWFI